MILNKYIPNNILYRVKKGEDIKAVANKFNTTIENVKSKSIGDLHEGEFVEILSSNQYTHIVKPLEDLNFIAKSYNVDVSHIIKSNNLKNKRLFIGQILRF